MGQRVGRRVRLRFGRVATRTRLRQRRMTTGRGITRQSDRRLIYRRKRMPYGKRRRWVRFLKKVQAVSTAQQGTRTIIRKPITLYEKIQNISPVGGVTPIRQQTVATFSLYGLETTAGELHNDLQRIAQLENTGAPTNTEGGTVFLSTKLQFRSAIFDLTVTNWSTRVTTANVTEPGFSELSAQTAMEVDVYEITAGKPFTASDAAGTIVRYNDLTELLQSRPLLKTDNEASFSNFDLEARLRGVSPWDFTAVLSKYRLKIHKKTKYFLDPGKSFTYQMRDPRNHMFTRDQMLRYQGPNFPGYTKWLYIIGKPLPGANAYLHSGFGDVGVGTEIPRLGFGLTKKYTYKIEGETDDRTFVFST